ncbi:MAG: ATP-binding protein [Prevotella sp.]|nr:ATP-binding protein [Prevotella sp.]
MFKSNIPLKVAVGYVFLVLVVCLALWLLYGNMKSLMRINDEEQLLMERRCVADSLINGFMDVDNKGHSIMFGLSHDMIEFDFSLNNTIDIADRLKDMTEEPGQKLRIDTLKILLLQKRKNTALMMTAMANDNSGKYYKNRLSNFQEGKDSMMIYTHTADTTKNSETVYEIVKTKKGFFPRLGDAFRRQHTDTMLMSRNSKLEVDSIKHNIDVADSVADVLSDIKVVEDKLRKEGLDKISARQKSLQMVSVNLASRIRQLLYDIRKGEQDSFKAAINGDIAERHNTMMRVLFLSVVSLVLSVILVIYVWRDSRRERHYRENLENAKAETERVMAQRERLLLTITHDIKAPAASISGFAELMEGQTVDKKLLSYLSSIKHSAMHLLHLIGELLDYHSLEDGKILIQSNDFSAKRLVVECVEEMLPQANSKRLDLSCNTDGCGEFILRGDALRISQILENLLSNALKYTSEGSVSVSAFVRDGKLCINVADTGQGMTKEESEKIFEAFTRLQDAQGIEGVGLGLSITKEFVQLLGGSINLWTEKGKGTEFRVAIPVEVTDEKELPVVQKSQENSDDNVILYSDSKEILVIDDDSLQLQLLSEMLIRLTNGKWNVTVCRQVDEGLHLLSSKRFDLLITDIEMPAMSGEELIGKFDHTGTVIVGMTAHERDIEPALLSSGFDACLFKPFTVRELADVLSNVTGADIKITNSKTPKVAERFSALTVFASGDEEAECEILSCFKYDLEQNKISLRSALDTNDRDEIARIAHKALPSISLVNTDAAEMLKHLSPKEIEKVTDTDLKKYVDAVMREMENLINELVFVK